MQKQPNCAFVEFQTPSQARAALKLNQNFYRNHKISIKSCDPDIVLELADPENGDNKIVKSTTSSYEDAAEDESTAVSSSKEHCDKHHSVFVSLLPETATHRELCHFFEKGLKRSRGITLKITRCYIPMKKSNEEWARAENECWARVHFEDRSHVQDALTLNGSTFQQTRISVKPWISHTEDQRGVEGGLVNIDCDSEQQDVIRWIYVGNLPNNAYSKELSAFILGRLEKTRGIKPVLLECKVRSSTKFAFVQFEDPAHALYALKLNGNTFRGNKITVEPRKIFPCIGGQEEDDSAMELATEENESENEQLGDEKGLLEAEYDPPTKEFSNDVSLSSIYVANVPDSVDSHFLSALFEKELRKVFEVKETDINILHCCIRKQERDAFIEFKTKEQAKWARGLKCIVLNKDVLTIRGWHPDVLPDIYKKGNDWAHGSKSSSSKSSTHEKQLNERRIESEAQIRVQRDLTARELTILRRENEQLNERAQSDICLHTELSHLRPKLVQLKGSETQIKDDISALRHENHQLKRKHYIDASDKLELLDLRRKEEQFKLDIAAKSQEINRMKRSLDLLQQESAELRSKLSEETRKESKVELEDSRREANSLRDEIDQIKANHATQVGFMEASMATSAVNENPQSELESAKKTIHSLETQIEGMRSYFQAAAAVFEAPRDEGSIQRRQEQPNSATIVKTQLLKEL
jgi:RNA recognition motif-containing protein